jgi:hypothetical protein
MQPPQWLARFNRHFINPIQRMWAGWAPTIGILEPSAARGCCAGRSSRLPFEQAVLLNGFSCADAQMPGSAPWRPW